jgi:hypothetical protein
MNAPQEAHLNDSPTVPIEAIQPDLNEFGKYVYRLMLTRGVTSFNALANKMATEDYPVYRQMVSRFVKEDHSVPPKFARRLSEVFELSEEEERELAWILYKYG